MELSLGVFRAGDLPLHLRHTLPEFVHVPADKDYLDLHREGGLACCNCQHQSIKGGGASLDRAVRGGCCLSLHVAGRGVESPGDATACGWLRECVFSVLPFYIFSFPEIQGNVLQNSQVDLRGFLGRIDEGLKSGWRAQQLSVYSQRHLGYAPT